MSISQASRPMSDRSDAGPGPSGAEAVVEIRRLLLDQPKVDRTYPVELRDVQGVVHAEVQKVIHISLRRPS